MLGCYDIGNSPAQEKHQYIKMNYFIAQSKLAVNAKLIWVFIRLVTMV